MVLKNKLRLTVAAVAFAGLTIAGGLSVSAGSDTRADQRAAASAKAAGKALSKHSSGAAIVAAENAVMLSPRNGGYRTLLGQSYLAAGRFTSAVTALNEALQLDPSDSAAALHLALAQIGTGDWSGAKLTLQSHDGIPAADRGLAFALAGDPATAVGILTAAARETGADAKTRQNLALSLALAGRWPDARTVASLDMSPADVDKRMLEWINFAQPKSAADQVAALLGVTPIEDAGRPAQLALSQSGTAIAAAAAPVDPVDAFMPDKGEVAVADVAQPQPLPVIEAAPAPVPMIAAPVAMADTGPKIEFAPRAEVAPAPVVVRQRVAVRTAVAKVAVAPRPVSKGNYFVQLGAFQNAAVAQNSWKRVARRTPGLVRYAPMGVIAKVNGASFYRLSVGGFSRTEAVGLCRQVRVKGGACFVRASTGEAMAAWSKVTKGVQMASR